MVGLRLRGFIVAVDAIVPCKVCGARIGERCVTTDRDKKKLRYGYVHFGRRLDRLLLTAGAPRREREKIERGLLDLVKEGRKR